MADSRIDSDLLLRVQRLERENRRTRLLAGLSTALLFVWTACSLAPAEKTTLAAERFLLVGPDGAEHGSLELDDAGNPRLLLQKEQASALLTLSGPSLLLRGPDGKTSAHLGIDSRNTSRLELTSERILDGVRVTVRPDGSAGLYVLDETGRERGGLEALSTGGSALLFRDTSGRVRSQYGIDPSGLANLLLLDSAGGRRLGMVVSEEGTPLVEMQDGGSRPRMQLTTLFDGSPRLEFHREDGGISFEAP